MDKLVDGQKLYFPIIIKLHWLDYAFLTMLCIAITAVVGFSIFSPSQLVNEAPILIKWVMLSFSIGLSFLFGKILFSDKTFLKIDGEKITIHDAFANTNKIYLWDEIEKIDFSFSRYSTMNLTFKNAKPLDNGKSVLIGKGKCLNGRLINARELADIIMQSKNLSNQSSINFHHTKMKFLDASY